MWYLAGEKWTFIQSSLLQFRNQALREIRILKALKLMNHVNIVKLFTMVSTELFLFNNLQMRLTCASPWYYCPWDDVLGDIFPLKPTTTNARNIFPSALHFPFQPFSCPFFYQGHVRTWGRWREGRWLETDHTRFHPRRCLYGLRICWLRSFRTTKVPRCGEWDWKFHQTILRFFEDFCISS